MWFIVLCDCVFMHSNKTGKQLKTSHRPSPLECVKTKGIPHTFKLVEDETLEEMWLYFIKVLEPCPFQGMTNKALLECLYRGIRTETRSIIDKRLPSGILLHPYEVVDQTLDNIARTYK